MEQKYIIEFLEKFESKIVDHFYEFEMCLCILLPPTQTGD